MSSNGWSAGVTAWVGTLFLASAGVLVVFRCAGVSLPMSVVGHSGLIAGVSAIGLLLVFIRWLNLPRHHGIGVAVGAKYGIYVALIAGVVEVAAAVSEMVASGEQTSWTRSRPAHVEPQG